MPVAESDDNIVPHWVAAYDALSWDKPQLPASDTENPDEIMSYYQFLKEYYPKDDPEHGAQNAKLFDDRLHSFSYPGAPGAKFKHAREKMSKCLSLPKGAKEELNYPQEIVDKILNGLPLWEERKDDDQDEEHEQESANRGKKELTQDQKNLMLMFGEGKYHMLPSFFRTLIYLKK